MKLSAGLGILLVVLLMPPAAAQQVSDVQLAFGAIAEVRVVSGGEGVVVAVPISVDVSTVCTSPGHLNLTVTAGSQGALLVNAGITPDVVVPTGTWGQAGMAPFHADVSQPVVVRALPGSDPNAPRASEGRYAYPVLAKSDGVAGCPPEADAAFRNNAAANATGSAVIVSAGPAPTGSSPPPPSVAPVRATPGVGAMGIAALLLLALRRR